MPRVIVQKFQVPQVLFFFLIQSFSNYILAYNHRSSPNSWDTLINHLANRWPYFNNRYQTLHKSQYLVGPPSGLGTDLIFLTTLFHTDICNDINQNYILFGFKRESGSSILCLYFKETEKEIRISFK